MSNPDVTLPETSGLLVPMQAQVPKEWAKLFQELYPMYGAVSYFYRTALEQFLLESLRNPSFREQVETAIRAMVADSLESPVQATLLTQRPNE